MNSKISEIKKEKYEYIPDLLIEYEAKIDECKWIFDIKRKKDH
jgi:hypothetical protein